MSETKSSRRRNRETEALIACRIEKIDRFLSRFYEDLATSDLKLADYARLADLESLAIDAGDEEVTVQWVGYETEMEKR